MTQFTLPDGANLEGLWNDAVSVSIALENLAETFGGDSELVAAANRIEDALEFATENLPDEPTPKTSSPWSQLSRLLHPGDRIQTYFRPAYFMWECTVTDGFGVLKAIGTGLTSDDALIDARNALGGAS